MRKQHVYVFAAALAVGALLLAAGYGLGRASRTEPETARADTRTVYVVQEFSWRWRSNRCPEILDDARPGKPVAVFGDRAGADAHCQQLNLQKQSTSNPFRYMPAGGEYSSMGRTDFLAFIRAQGLAPPADYPGGEDDPAWTWWEWWEAHVQQWDVGLIQRLWAALDRLQFYEVVEVPLER